MRTVLVIAAVALLHAAAPAGATPQREKAPRAAPGCATKAATARAGRPAAARRSERRRSAGRPGAARRRAARRGALGFRCVRTRAPLVGMAGSGRAGAPGAFGAPAAFTTAPAGAAPAPAGAPAAPPAPGEPAGPALPPVYSNPRALQVRAFEFRFQLSKGAVAAGDVAVEFNLASAEDPHDLWLVREDGTGPAHAFGETPAGAVVRDTFALTEGRWTLFCSLTGHQAAGMRSTLTVG